MHLLCKQQDSCSVSSTHVKMMGVAAHALDARVREVGTQIIPEFSLMGALQASKRLSQMSQTASPRQHLKSSGFHVQMHLHTDNICMYANVTQHF